MSLSHSTSDGSKSASQASEPSTTHVHETLDTSSQYILEDDRLGYATAIDLKRSKKKVVWEDRFLSLDTFTDFCTLWTVRSLYLGVYLDVINSP